MVQEHNQRAAQMWSKGGRDYDWISYNVSDALAHANNRLWAKPGEKILDVATGTGWTARNVARFGARVTGVDIAEDLLAAASELSAQVQPPIEFRAADAEALPFADGSFDGVISTFGVMFAGNQEQAARELGRVCRKGGRLVLATWSAEPDSFVARFFAVMGRHNPAPPPPVSPFEWGRPDRLRQLLGQDFELAFEPGVTTFHGPDSSQVWDRFVAGFGPVKALYGSLDESKRENLKRDFIAFHDQFRTELGLRLDRAYLLTVGKRR